jgi:hypothetical protein
MIMRVDFRMMAIMQVLMALQSHVGLRLLLCWAIIGSAIKYETQALKISGKLQRMVFRQIIPCEHFKYGIVLQLFGRL